jgi:F-type H+-transporting ATPase subunit epsilon
MEVTGQHVTILADSAERAEEIDAARADAARRRAEDRLRQHRRDDVDFARAEAALRRSMVRLRVAQRAGQGQGRSGGPPQS